MKTIIIYESGTGFTEQYAKWISEALDCECKKLKKVSPSELKEFDRIVFGGWIIGGGIMGLEKMRSIKKPFAVFAVGATLESKEIVSAIKTQNKLDDIPLFYMTGGFRFEKLNFLYRAMLKTLKKIVAKKTDRTSQEEFMAQYLGTSFDHSEKSQIMPLVEYCR